VDTSGLERATQAPPELSIQARVAGLAQSEGLNEMDALKKIARERGISKSEAYRELQRERAKR
jgi:16S rRNA (cytidine1402-2'-O)-methyltransferase